MSAASRGADRRLAQAAGKNHDRALALARTECQQRQAGRGRVSMEPLQILERVKNRFGDRVLETIDKNPDPFAVVDPKAIVEIGRFMNEDPELAMDCLSNQSGVDYKDRVEVVYHLFSYKHRHGAVLKVKLPRENPSIATVESVWKSANWMEREIFDLLGVNF